MSDTDRVPLVSSPAAAAAGGSIGDDPAERVPITNVVGTVETILRQPRRLAFQLSQPGAARLIAAMLVGAVVCSATYGVVVGSFSGGSQLWAAPVKLSAGLLISAIICLPSLYILASLSGSRAGLRELIGLLAGLLLLMTVLLVGFVPVAWVFSQSTDSPVGMGSLHLLFWLVATAFGLRFLRAGLAHQQTKSNAGFNLWVIIFTLVMLQMTTALRPILGTADTFLPTQKKLFLTHWLDSMK